MEALSKASGAETAVGEGDKRQAEPGGLELLWEAPPPPTLRGGFKERRRDAEKASEALDEMFK